MQQKRAKHRRCDGLRGRKVDPTKMFCAGKHIVEDQIRSLVLSLQDNKRVIEEHHQRLTRQRGAS